MKKFLHSAVALMAALLVGTFISCAASDDSSSGSISASDLGTATLVSDLSSRVGKVYKEDRDSKHGNEYYLYVKDATTINHVQKDDNNTYRIEFTATKNAGGTFSVTEGEHAGVYGFILADGGFGFGQEWPLKSGTPPFATYGDDEHEFTLNANGTCSVLGQAKMWKSYGSGIIVVVGEALLAWDGSRMWYVYGELSETNDSSVISSVKSVTE